jgi:uncharacterized protein (DUF885 family)
VTDAVQTRFVSLAPDSRPAPKSDFERALHKLLDDAFALEPVWATDIGYHAYDDRWPDLSEAGRQAALSMVRHHRARLTTFDEANLPFNEQIDLAVVREFLDGWEFSEGVLSQYAWDPLSYIQQAGSGLFALLAREYAPWAHRGWAFVGRVQRLAQFLASAGETLVGTPQMPVSRPHTETAIAQLRGIMDLVEQGLAEARQRGADGEETELVAALEAAIPGAQAAVDAFGATLENEVRERATGNGRLGRDLYGQKLHYTLSSDLTPEDLLARAEHSYQVVRSEMIRIAREMWPTWVADKPLPDDESDVVKGVLDVIALDHPTPDQLLEWTKQEILRIEAFCRERGIITLPTDPLQVVWTPVFMRPYGGAFLSPPGPLDKGQDSYYFITPPDETKGPEAVESYLREGNFQAQRLTSIHEAIPGHYLQLNASNQSKSLARSVFWSGPFAEGWAVYVTQVMMDAGYGDDDPALWLSHWKYYLRAITNAIMDVRIQCLGMTEDEAMELMISGGFQETHEAQAKWLRAQLTSTQLVTYYLGSVEMWDLEIEARKRAVRAAGAPESAVPSQKIAGGLGATPGFDHRRHLEAVIAHGTPPIKWVGRILAQESAA